MLGTEDIAALHVQLILKTVLLNGFSRRYVIYYSVHQTTSSINPMYINTCCYESCKYSLTRTELAALLGLDGMKSIPVTPIVSFAANADTEMAYKQFCRDLFQIGITNDIIRQKGDEILEILRSQGMVDNSQIVASDTRDEEDKILETAYKQFCEELFQIGVTEDLIPPQYKVLGILRSRSIVAGRQSVGQSSGRNAEDRGQFSCLFFPYVQLLTYKQITLEHKLCLHLGQALIFG